MGELKNKIKKAIEDIIFRENYEKIDEYFDTLKNKLYQDDDYITHMTYFKRYFKNIYGIEITNENESPKLLLTNEEFLPYFVDHGEQGNFITAIPKFLFKENLKKYLYDYIINDIDDDYSLDKINFIVDKGSGWEDWNDEIDEFINYISKYINLNELDLGIFYYSIPHLYEKYDENIRRENPHLQNADDISEIVQDILHEDINTSIDKFKSIFDELFRVWKFSEKYDIEEYIKNHINNELDEGKLWEYAKDNLGGIKFLEFAHYQNEDISYIRIEEFNFKEMYKMFKNVEINKYEKYIKSIFKQPKENPDRWRKRNKIHITGEWEYLIKILKEYKNNKHIINLLNKYIFPKIINIENLTFLPIIPKFEIYLNRKNKNKYLHTLVRGIC